jgi:hypothetical protein
VLGNAIYANLNLGLDLNGDGVTLNDAGDVDNGPNGLQNFPVLDQVNAEKGDTKINGSLISAPNTTYRIEFFSSPSGDASGYGEGRVYRGFALVTTDGAGNGKIKVKLLGYAIGAGEVMSATATEDLGGGNYGGTSEFARNASATAALSGFIVSPISGNTTEAGGSASFSVSLSNSPFSPVTISVNSSNAGEGVANVTQLTFDSSNWNIAQTVTVTGQQDFNTDGNTSYSIVLGSAISADVDYNGLTPASLTLSNLEGPNQAPSISYTGVSPATVNEDGALTFSSAAGNSIVLSDLDAGTHPLQLTLTVTNGVLTLGGLTGITMVSGANASNAMTISGTLSDLNAALSGLSIAPSANFNGASSLNLVLNDQGNSGTGGSLQTSLSIALTVMAINDAPTTLAAVATLPSIAEDTASPSGTDIAAIFGGLYADAIDSPFNSMHLFSGVALRSVVQVPAEGVWQYQLAASATWTTIGALSDNAALALGPNSRIRFLPVANYNGVPSSTLSVRVLDSTAAFSEGGLIDVSVLNATNAFSAGVINLVTTVTAVNDAPTLTSNGGGTNTGLGIVNAVMSENSIANLLTLTASDIDLPGDVLRYSLSGGEDMALFAIDANTGALSLNLALLPQGLNFEAPLDANHDGVYLVEVSVSDGAGGFDTQTVRLTISDQAEPPTAIAGTIAPILENTDTSSSISVLNAIDLAVSDQDLGEVHTLSIVGGVDASRFSLLGSPGNYQLVFNAGVLNFEIQSSYQVTLRATDVSGLAFDRSFQLTVLDQNEAPNLTPLSLSLTENPLANQLLGTMNFRDQDQGDTISVRILAPQAGTVDAALLSALSIDVSGQVRIADAARFDFESRLAGLEAHQLRLNVEITDAKGLVSQANLTITLQDVNEAPTDLRAALKLSVNAPGDAIANLMVSDQDSPEQLTYTLLNNPDQAFSLNAATGSLSLTATGQGLLSSGRTEALTITVTDKGGLQMTRTFALKLPDYFPPQPGSTSGAGAGSGNGNTPEAIRPSETILVAGTSPSTSTPVVNNNRPRVVTQEPVTLGELSSINVALGNEVAREDDNATSVLKARTRRFETPAININPVQAFTINFAANAQITDFGGNLSFLSPELNLSTDRAAFERGGTGVQISSGYARPSISGRLTAGNDIAEEQRDDGKSSLVRLIGQEPLYIASALISAGAVWWVARGLALATAMMMGAPAWRQVDLLPVVLVRENATPLEDPEAKVDGHHLVL